MVNRVSLFHHPGHPDCCSSDLHKISKCRHLERIHNYHFLIFTDMSDLHLRIHIIFRSEQTDLTTYEDTSKFNYRIQFLWRDLNLRLSRIKCSSNTLVSVCTA
jgi:hypothetical protein